MKLKLINLSLLDVQNRKTPLKELDWRGADNFLDQKEQGEKNMYTEQEKNELAYMNELGSIGKLSIVGVS